MTAAAADHGGSGGQWQRTMMTATADNNSGGRQRWRMMTACEIGQWTTRGKEENGGKQQWH